MSILYSVIALAGLGLLFGILITFASKKFEVKKDDRVEKITELLPGANCGGCGFAGCSAYAQAIVDGKAEPNLCNSCSSDKLGEIAEILGVEIKMAEPCIAYVMCCGNSENTTEKYNYDGVKNCVSAMRISGGFKSCQYACLGFGNCAEVCTNNAIKITDGVAEVIEEKCGGCGACVKACPKGIIALVPKSAKYVVKCSSKDKGIDTKNSCKVGCISCKLCEKNCPSDAIHVENNVAVIDYKKCTSCGACADKCPRHIIVKKMF